MPKKWLPLWLLIILSLGIQSTWAQDDEALPPQIIDIQPLPGAEIPSGEPLTIMFNQPMDRPSVESALEFEPTLEGSFTWADDQTVQFNPESDWPQNTTYTVTVNNSAQAVNGLTLLDPFQFEAKTIGALVVSAVQPEPDSEGIAADSRIIATFNRPVVPLASTEQQADLPIPLTFEPNIEGSGEWINTSIYAFTPSEPLSGSTTYTVTVEDGISAFDGAVLDESFSWSFTTLPPQVLSISPTASQQYVKINEPVVITFSQPMDHESTEVAFSLISGGEKISGDSTWSDDDTVLTFTPEETFSLDTNYVINLNQSAKSASGQAELGTNLTQGFSTLPYPSIVSTRPANGEGNVNLNFRVSLSFNTLMNHESLRDKIVISPEPGDVLPSLYDDAGYSDLYLNFRPEPLTTYTITILAGAEDIYGNAIQDDFSFSYTTADIPTTAYPIVNGAFMLTGAHRENTRMAMIVSGTPTAFFSLYDLDTEDLAVLDQRNTYDYFLDASQENTPPWLDSPDKLLRSWSQSFDSEGIERMPVEILLASENGGTLDPGLYYMSINGTQPYGGSEPQWYGFALAVATANITVKRAAEEMLVWVTDMPSAEPVGNTNVTIYHNGEAVASGQTDSEGIFRTAMDIPNDDPNVFVVAESEGVYSAWYSDSQAILPTEIGYLYTDRPVYRPGETVYFRGVLRDRRDMNYSVPDIATVPVEIRHAYSEEEPLYQENLEVSGFGTFSGEFVIPEDAGLGEFAIQAEFGESNYYWYGDSPKLSEIIFNVAEFRVPEYEVNVTPQRDEIIQRDPLNTLAEAKYYFGGAVSEASITWTASGEATSFNYNGRERYNFYDETLEYFYYTDLGSNIDIREQTNDEGRFLISSTQTAAPVSRPMRITVEATVVDESGQAISNRASVLAHPANVYVGLRSDNRFGDADTPVMVEVIAVRPDSQPIPSQRVTLELVETRWTRIPRESQFGQYDWIEEVIPVETQEVTTGSDGTASYTFTPPNGGIFRVRAVTQDEQERSNSSSMRFWVIAPNQRVWWGNAGGGYIEMVVDKDSYVPGDTAQILIPIPFDGESTVLVSVDRADIMTHEVLQANGSTLVYELPITEDFVPNIYFDVTIVRGIDEENPNPDYLAGNLHIRVEPVSRRLNVEVTPSSRLNEPDDTVSFDVVVTDANGEPAQAEVGMALTDEAVLALMPPNSGPPEDTFYRPQLNYVYDTIAMSALLDLLTDAQFGGKGGGGGGGGGGEAFNIREDFEYTPLWAPHVVTDERGRATVSVTLPDNLTTWKLDARAVDLKTHVGQATTEIISTLPLIVRPAVPRFFVVGDRVTLAAVINNNTDADQVVQVELQQSGLQLVDPIPESVTIEGGSRARVEWTAVVEDVANIDLTFFASDEMGHTDAVKPALATGPDGTIPVYKYVAPDTVGTGGVLHEGGSKTEAISLPPRLQTLGGELTVRLDSSLAATTIDTLDYLKNYPHQCIEQTVSRFLPNVITYRALESLGVQDAKLKANLDTVLVEALNQLYQSQNPDGGWGWFPNKESNPLVTAYALLGLIEVQDARIASINAGVIDRGIEFLKTDFVRPVAGGNTPAYRLNRQAFYYYVLARYGQGSESEYILLYNTRLNMSYMGRAYLLMAAQEMTPQSALIPGLVSDLTNAAIISATGAHWEEGEPDWWNWGSDTRTTAVVLNALVRVNPENPLLPNAVRWLMVARQGDHWQTTQESAWSVMALTDWMVATGELQANYTYEASLNRASLVEETITPEIIRQSEVLKIQVTDLLADEINRLTIGRTEGSGALYYTAHLDLELLASEVEAANRGIIVAREYYLDGDEETPITEAQVGDMIDVRLTITLPEDIYYFVLEDPIPAGTEGVDTSLLTTSQQADDPTIRRETDYNPYWYWGWWWFDKTELRDAQTNLYADFLPRGTYVYSYQIRASVPGEFQTRPAHAYAFYFPEVFGRTDGQLFTVLPTEE